MFNQGYNKKNRNINQSNDPNQYYFLLEQVIVPSEVDD